jgi:hypothetical protein
MSTVSREEIASFWKQHAYCEKKRAEATSPRETAKILIRPYALYEGWTLEELENSIMGNGYVQIGGCVFLDTGKGQPKQRTVARGRIVVTRTRESLPCLFSFSLAELYTEVVAELGKPQQLSLFGMAEGVAG